MNCQFLFHIVTEYTRFTYISFIDSVNIIFTPYPFLFSFLHPKNMKWVWPFYFCRDLIFKTYILYYGCSCWIFQHVYPRKFYVLYVVSLKEIFFLFIVCPFVLFFLLFTFVSFNFCFLSHLNFYTKLIYKRNIIINILNK